jgi:hypothetical protein
MSVSIGRLLSAASSLPCRSSQPVATRQLDGLNHMTDKKTLSIDDLRRSNSKKVVSTSLGLLYVRRLVYGDYEKILGTGQFKSTDEREVGRLAIQAITSISQVPSDWNGLNDDAFSRLQASDLDALAAAAIEVSEYPVTEDLMAGLGRGILDQYAELGQASKKIFDQIQKGFPFLQPSTKNALTASVAAIELSNQKWKAHFLDKFKGSTAWPSAVDSIKAPQMDHSLLRRRDITLPSIDISNMPESRAAKASEQAVDVLEKLAAHMSEVQAHTASMYQTIVLEAIPQWMDQQKGNKVQSELSLTSAASSLCWTKWAVIIGVVTSVGIAIYQQHTGSADADAALRQANERQAYWEKQAATQQALLNTQTQATQNLQIELKSLNALLVIKSQTSQVPAAKRTNPGMSKSR